jgi:hypothetical protein
MTKGMSHPKASKIPSQEWPHARKTLDSPQKSGQNTSNGEEYAKPTERSNRPTVEGIMPGAMERASSEPI